MEQSQALNDILETVQFIRDHAVSKEDLKEFATKEDLKDFATKEDLKQFATKEDLKEQLAEVKNEIMTHVDGFVVLHQKFDAELAALQYKYDRMDTNLTRVLHHLHLEPAT